MTNRQVLLATWIFLFVFSVIMLVSTRNVSYLFSVGWLGGLVTWVGSEELMDWYNNRQKD